MQPQPWFFVTILGVVVVGGIIGWRLDQKRQEALRTWAFARGWRVRPGGGEGPLLEHPAVKLFHLGHSRRCNCVIEGDLGGQPLQLFDYRYVTGHGKNRTTHQYWVAILNLPYPVRPLRIRPENPFDKVGEFLGADDIDFESAEFSRRFFVTADDRKWAYDIIHARMMEFLLASSGGHSLEFGSHELVVFNRGGGKAEHYEAAMALLQGIRDRIPDYVVRQQWGEDT
jgi:hypothetical protein